MRSWRLRRLRLLHRLINPVLLEFRINGLSQPGLCKADHLRTANVEELLQFRCGVMLHDRVMREVSQDLLPAVFGNVRSDENEMQLALAARQRIATDDQAARLQYEGK